MYYNRVSPYIDIIIFVSGVGTIIITVYLFK